MNLFGRDGIHRVILLFSVSRQYDVTVVYLRFGRSQTRCNHDRLRFNGMQAWGPAVDNASKVACVFIRITHRVAVSRKCARKTVFPVMTIGETYRRGIEMNVLSGNGKTP